MRVPRAPAIGVLAAIWWACGGKTDAPTAGSPGSGGGATSATSTQSAASSGATGGSSGAGTVGGSGGTGGDIDPGTTGGGGGVLDASTTGCSINSDCDEPLVCAFHRCHSQCQTTRDCAAGVRCVHARDADTGALLGNVCQLADERACVQNAECPPAQVCAVDGQCRDLCDADRDCVTAQVCRIHTCAESFELDAEGTLNQVIDGGSKPDGAPLRDPDGG